MAGYGDIVMFRRLLRQARPYWPHVGALFLLSLLSGPLALLAPLPLKIAVDSVIGSHPLPRHLDPLVPEALSRSPATLLAFAIGLLVAVALLNQLQGLASALLRAYVKEKLVLDFQARLFRHVQRLSLAYHDGRGTADSTYRIKHDAPAIDYVLTESVIPFIASTVTLVGMIYVMVRIDWQLALIAIAVSPGLFLTSRAFRRRLRRQSREVKKLESSALSIVQEVLGALRIVKAFGQESREEQRFVRRSREGLRARLRLAGMEGTFNLFVGLTTAAGMAAVLLIGVLHVRSGALTLGELLMVMGYLNQLYEPLKTISRKAASLQLHLASAERAFALLDEPSDVQERPNARSLARARGGVVFHHVSFAYGQDRPVLHDISFDVEPGTRLGVAGASGAGKSTLISLLTRFYDPSAGKIWLDGVDLCDYKLEDLRRQFAVVPQDPVLFSASIAENIAYAKPEATRDELIAAAQAADAHDFIVQLPQGYDTQVGERGVQLSGGQRQRIAIARAFLKDSPVLVLDEPTSAVDAEAEAAILGALRRLMRGRTVILITHRPSMLEGCAALLVLENGHVVTDTTRPLNGARPAATTAATSERRSHLMNHPVVHAWCQLYPQAVPRGIAPLRIRRKKNRVYRLDGAGPDGTAVIAKWCPTAVARVERTVSGGILPGLSVPALRHYGFLDDPDGEHGWLFMEEAVGVEYSNLLAEHRVQAGRWLGLLHTAAAEAAAKGQLPDAGPGRYFDLMRGIRELVRQHLDNPVLSPDDVAILEAIQARLDDLATHWDRLEEICAGVPPTLVHGDFNGKNMRLRSMDGNTSVVVFDWEHAGWGVPAVDLARLTVPFRRLAANPDIATYWSTVRERWPNASAEAVRRLADCGTVFRTLSALSWDAQHLPYDWAHMYVAGMQTYAAELDEALERLGWDGCSAPATAAGRATTDRAS
jgi:ATP-binding cassette subfamily B protein